MKRETAKTLLESGEQMPIDFRFSRYFKDVPTGFVLTDFVLRSEKKRYLENDSFLRDKRNLMKMYYLDKDRLESILDKLTEKDCIYTMLIPNTDLLVIRVNREKIAQIRKEKEM